VGLVDPKVDNSKIGTPGADSWTSTEEIRYNIATGRVTKAVDQILDFKSKKAWLLEPCVRVILERFSGKEIVKVILNCTLTPVLDYRNEEEMVRDDEISDDGEQNLTTEAGVYLWQIGGETKASTYRAARYVGSSWGSGDTYFRIHCYKNVNYRHRTMAKKRSLAYEYAEGVYGERKKSQFTSLAMVRRSVAMGSNDTKAWCPLTETIFMLRSNLPVRICFGLDLIRKFEAFI
jgi:hypothetical protein